MARWGNDENFEKIRKGGKGIPDERKLTKKERDGVRDVARKGKNTVRSLG